MTLGEFVMKIPQQSLARSAAVAGAAVVTMIHPLLAFVLIVLAFVLWVAWKLARLLLALLLTVLVVAGMRLTRFQAGYPHLFSFLLWTVLWGALFVFCVHRSGATVL